MYGPFTNELLVGRALGGRRDDAFLSTKCLLPWCAALGVGMPAAMPLGSGYLTGTPTPGQGFEPPALGSWD